MKHAYIGKIGRLPARLRNEVGQRLEDGQEAETILQWLNAEAEVQAVLKKHFAEPAVNKQNLSAWRQQGHQDWLELQERRGLVRQWSEEALALNGENAGGGIGDSIAARLAVELAQLGAKLVAEAGTVEERWARLKEVNRELSRLRRDDQRAAGRRLAEAKQAEAVERQAQLAKAQAEATTKAEALAWCYAPVEQARMEEEFRGLGQGRGKKMAKLVHAIRFEGAYRDERYKALALELGLVRPKQKDTAKPGPMTKAQAAETN